jgi:hypothetical protein
MTPQNHSRAAHRYYSQQRGMDAASGGMARDDAKRHARAAREREAEQATIAALFEVRLLGPRGCGRAAWPTVDAHTAGARGWRGLRMVYPWRRGRRCR